MTVPKVLIERSSWWYNLATLSYNVLPRLFLCYSLSLARSLGSCFALAVAAAAAAGSRHTYKSV